MCGKNGNPSEKKKKKNPLLTKALTPSSLGTQFGNAEQMGPGPGNLGDVWMITLQARAVSEQQLGVGKAYLSPKVI